MKVLHICTFDTGGAAIAAIRQHIALLKNGIDSNILFVNLTKSDIPNSYSFIYPSKGTFEKLTYRIQRKLGLKRTYWELANDKTQGRTKEFELFSLPHSDYDITTQEIYKNADIINLHWVNGFVDYKFFIKNKKPVVWTLHDMNPFTGGCHYSGNCNGFMNNCTTCPQLEGTKDISVANKNLLYKEKSLIESKINVICLNQWMYKNVSKSKLFKNNPIRIIRNTLNTNIFKPINKEFVRDVFDVPRDKTIILFISERVSNKRKGLQILDEAIINCKNEQLVFYAIGEKNIAEKKSDKILFTGSIKDERLMAILYNAADAIVIPSIEDNLPNVMLEALACGIPVISFPVGGMLDVIQTGRNGVLATGISSEKLSVAINFFLLNKNNFHSREIRLDTLRLFGNKSIAKEYTKLYEKAISDKKRK